MTMLFIGVSVYFIGRVSTMLSYTEEGRKEIKLEDIHELASAEKEPFILTDFYYRQADLNRLNGQGFRPIIIYSNGNDSIARVAIETDKKSLFIKEIQESGKILVTTNGGLWDLSTPQGVKTFGYGYMDDETLKSFKEHAPNGKFDENIDRSIMLRHVPREKLSDNWMEIVGFSILIILLLTLAIVSFRQAKKSGQF